MTVPIGLGTTERPPNVATAAPVSVIAVRTSSATSGVGPDCGERREDDCSRRQPGVEPMHRRRAPRPPGGRQQQRDGDRKVDPEPDIEEEQLPGEPERCGGGDDPPGPVDRADGDRAGSLDRLDPGFARHRRLSARCR
jgi:hypothetical protein